MTIARVIKVLEAAPNPVMVGYVGAAECQGSNFHNPKPMVVKPTDLTKMVSMIAVPIKEDVVYLCGTCAENLETYIKVLSGYDGKTPNAVRRDFGNIIRDLGDRAWAHKVGA